ncbi:hypothetical protein PG985_003521 [Apiospora marii]|uniref:Uncharacterized protein n=1 Tax=Apiospora marii TaxID=335849 RepID=A0ABR1SHT2_9PEZI
MEFQRAEGRPIHVLQAGKTALTSNHWGTADGKISTKNIFEAEINFAEAKRETILVHGFFGSQGWATDHPAREVRITLNSDLSYRVTHCIPDFRSDPETGIAIVTLMPLSGHDNFVFVESPFAPPFVVMWTLTWCKVNDIDNVRAGVLALKIPDSEQWPPEEVWEKAKYMAQSGAVGSPFGNSLCWDRLRRTKVSQHTLKREKFEMTANLVEKSFLSQSTVELQISITKPGSPSTGPQQEGLT